MKQALVQSLLKKRSLDREVLKNYRPVSNLSYTSKLLERVVAARLNSHMNNHNIHERVQSAYKPGHSTETALLRVQNDILTNMDNQSVTVLILLDLSAAFDTIDHHVLLDCMENMVGVKGTPLQWFSSYLSTHTVIHYRSCVVTRGSTTSVWSTARLCPWTTAVLNLHPSPRCHH